MLRVIMSNVVAPSTILTCFVSNIFLFRKTSYLSAAAASHRNYFKSSRFFKETKLEIETILALGLLYSPNFLQLFSREGGLD
jgi:hypothetical protein